MAIPGWMKRIQPKRDHPVKATVSFFATVRQGLIQELTNSGQLERIESALSEAPTNV